MSQLDLLCLFPLQKLLGVSRDIRFNLKINTLKPNLLFAVSAKISSSPRPIDVALQPRDPPKNEKGTKVTLNKMKFKKINYF